jgi:hypothetical protein
MLLSTPVGVRRNYQKGALKRLSLYKKLFIFATLMLLGTSMAFADAITFSASVPAVGYLNYSGSGITAAGTTWTADNVDLITTYWTGHGGTNSIDLNGSGSGGTLTGTLNTVASASYTLVFWYTGNPEGAAQSILRSAGISVGGTALSDLTAQGTTQVVADRGNITTTTPWQQFSYTFTATGTTQVVLTGKQVTSYGIAVSDMSLTQNTQPTNNVPEPATLAVMGAGLLLIGLKKLRKA